MRLLRACLFGLGVIGLLPLPASGIADRAGPDLRSVLGAASRRLVAPAGPRLVLPSMAEVDRLPQDPIPERTASGFTRTDLGTLGGTATGVVGINERGQVVGISQTGAGAWHAFLWETGVMTDLDSNTWFSTAVAINERGQVVVASQQEPAGRVTAFVWHDGVRTDLGRLGSRGEILETLPVAINERGQVVGTSYGCLVFGYFCGYRAFQSQDGVMTDLGGLRGGVSESYAFDINERGQVVGASTVDQDQRLHACLWENGVATDLGTLGGDFSVALAINERGQVVGLSETAPAREWHGFVWQDGVMTDLGFSILPVGVTNQPDLNFPAINERDQIVGTLENYTEETLDAFLWRDGELTELGTLGGAHAFARDINERGQVVGDAATADGAGHAFLWQNGFMTDLGAPAGAFSYAVDINNRGQVVGSFGSRAVLWTPASAVNAHVAGLAPSLHPEGEHSTFGGSERCAVRVSSRPGALPVQFELPGLPQGTHRVSIFDVQGRAIRCWERAASSGAGHSWDGLGSDGAAVGPGIYFVRVETGVIRLGAKVLVVR